MEKSSLEKIWNQVPVDYYQSGIKNNYFQKLWHLTKLNSAKKILGKFKFKNCLDVGCASGYMTYELSKAFPNAKFYGVDVYKKAVDYARAHYSNVFFKVAKAEKLPFKNQSFDLVLYYETLEHVEEPLRSLQEIRRVLKQNGIAVIAMDSGSLLFKLIWYIWLKYKGKVWQGGHLNPFTQNQLEKIIKKSGLKINNKMLTHLNMEVTFITQK